MPFITVFDGTSFVTTDPAPITTLSPILTGRIVEFEPILTLLPTTVSLSTQLSFSSVNLSLALSNSANLGSCGLTTFFEYKWIKFPGLFGFKVISVGDIHYTNSSGQVNNSARSIGTDNVNFAAIKNSFENQGINPNFLPPVILEYYVDGNHVLSTHTSNSQIHYMNPFSKSTFS